MILNGVVNFNIKSTDVREHHRREADDGKKFISLVSHMVKMDKDNAARSIKKHGKVSNNAVKKEDRNTIEEKKSIGEFNKESNKNVEMKDESVQDSVESCKKYKGARHVQLLFDKETVKGNLDSNEDIMNLLKYSFEKRSEAIDQDKGKIGQKLSSEFSEDGKDSVNELKTIKRREAVCSGKVSDIEEILKLKLAQITGRIKKDQFVNRKVMQGGDLSARGNQHDFSKGHLGKNKGDSAKEMVRSQFNLLFENNSVEKSDRGNNENFVSKQGDINAENQFVLGKNKIESMGQSQSKGDQSSFANNQRQSSGIANGSSKATITESADFQLVKKIKTLIEEMSYTSVRKGDVKTEPTSKFAPTHANTSFARLTGGKVNGVEKENTQVPYLPGDKDIKKEINEIEIKLDSLSKGQLLMQIEWTKNGLRAHFLPDSLQGHMFLASHLSEIRHHLETSGIKIHEMNLLLSNDSNGGSGAYGREGSQHSSFASESEHSFAYSHSVPTEASPSIIPSFFHKEGSSVSWIA